MRTELCTVAATVTDYWNFHSSIKRQRAELAGDYAVEVLAFCTLRGCKSDSTLRESFECALLTRQCALGQCAESASDDVERILKRLIHSDKHSNSRRVNCVVQVSRTCIDTTVASDATLRVFDFNVESHLAAFRSCLQRLLSLRPAPELVEVLFDL